MDRFRHLIFGVMFAMALTIGALGVGVVRAREYRIHQQPAQVTRFDDPMPTCPPECPPTCKSCNDTNCVKPLRCK